MHIPETFTLRFDPEESENLDIKMIFRNKTAKIIWCAIKSAHVTDQYFNSTVLEVGETLTHAEDPCDYRAFLALTAKLNRTFGRICVYESLMQHQYEIDHEFWSDIFKAINGRRAFNIEVRLPVTTTQRG
jgi:hypothetical protein